MLYNTDYLTTIDSTDTSEEHVFKKKILFKW